MHKILHSRRDFLKKSALFTAAIIIPQKGFSKSVNEKKLSFYNIHTGEFLETAYWIEGKYIKEEVESINKILRDYRTGEIKQIDIKLIDLLFDIKNILNKEKSFHIISGYRSPKTNAYLRKISTGVAKKSFHMKGKAIDIYLPGIDLYMLRKAAMSLKKGGVGYYPKSHFVHVDTGPVRYW
ncbi:YcbK family protein [Nitrosophilus kaiyonis]|uniref:YcbK family protein n=1 Tax=Nitrosophilus kaiyonis TaxID=2930200 RepID=UPI00249291DD|nr:YcbK family protein [Nitrosophilus kaiyonis]